MSRLHLFRTSVENRKKQYNCIPQRKSLKQGFFCTKSLLENAHFKHFLVKHDSGPKKTIEKGDFGEETAISKLHLFRTSGENRKKTLQLTSAKNEFKKKKSVKVFLK